MIRASREGRGTDDAALIVDGVLKLGMSQSMLQCMIPAAVDPLQRFNSTAGGRRAATREGEVVGRTVAGRWLGPYLYLYLHQFSLFLCPVC